MNPLFEVLLVVVALGSFLPGRVSMRRKISAHLRDLASLPSPGLTPEQDLHLNGILHRTADLIDGRYSGES